MGDKRERLLQGLKQDDWEMRRWTVFHVLMAVLVAEALIALIVVLYR
jgi:hypothetical protein